MNAARAKFSAHDPAEVSMLDIAKSAGTSVGAIYLSFESREALIDAIVEDVGSEIATTVRDALRSVSTKSVPDAIREVARAYVDVCRRNAALMPLIASQFARSTSRSLITRGGGAVELRHMLTAAFGTLAAGTPIDVDVSVLSLYIGSAWQLTGMSVARREPSDDSVVAQSLADITTAILHGVAPAATNVDARTLAHVMAQFAAVKS